MRIVILPSFKKPEITRKLLKDLPYHIYLIVLSARNRAYRLYAAELIELSEKLPYPIIHNLDEKLGVTLSWKHLQYHTTETKEALAKKMLSLKPSDFQLIVDEFSKFFNIKLPNIEDIIEDFLENRIDEGVFKLKLSLALSPE